MTVNQFDVIEVAVVHVNDGVDQQVNVYQFQKTDATPTLDADLLIDVAQVVQAIYTLLVSLITVRNVLSDVIVRNKTQGVLIGSADGGTYVGGTAVGDAWPNGAAGMTFWKTNIPRVIMKKYWPSGVATDLSPGGNPDSVWLANMILVGILMLVPFIEANTTLQYGYLSPKTLSFELPGTAHVPQVMSYQRRRKAGTGS